MIDREKLAQLIREHGYDDIKWLSGEDVVVCQWPRFKCMYGCATYGHDASCPPNNPPISECREFIREYRHIAVIHLKVAVDDPEDRKAWSRKTNLHLLKLERAAFFAGCYKAFLLFMDECRICADCAEHRNECKNMELSRPSPEGLGVDVFATVRKLGYPLEVLTNYQQEMNRYSFLLVD
jgi:predicted metal-binding protein